MGLVEFVVQKNVRRIVMDAQTISQAFKEFLALESTVARNSLYPELPGAKELPLSERTFWESKKD